MSKNTANNNNNNNSTEYAQQGQDVTMQDRYSWCDLTKPCRSEGESVLLYSAVA